MTSAKKFQLIAKYGKARAGKYTTAHGEFLTPIFMPVGTAGTVKAMKPESVADTGSRVILGNTYHLMLRPSAERIAEFGGLHSFMNWHHSILTDSGGFQVMSLSSLRKITENGVVFRSHIDGSSHNLTPERSIEIQYLLGSDITMIFDECPSYPLSYEKVKASMELSLRWAERSKKTFIARNGYSIFGIVQGGIHEDLRKISSRELVEIGFDGYAIGGLAVGEGQELMLQTLDFTLPMLPEECPRYLMGVGKPSDIIAAVLRGVDMFDCVIPTRSGRNGQAFTSLGTMNLRNARYADDTAPLDLLCHCYCCNSFSRAYLHHLIKSREILASMLLSEHNINFYMNLVADLRNSIIAGNLEEVVQRYKSTYD